MILAPALICHHRRWIMSAGIAMFAVGVVAVISIYGVACNDSRIGR